MLDIIIIFAATSFIMLFHNRQKLASILLGLNSAYPLKPHQLNLLGIKRFLPLLAAHSLYHQFSIPATPVEVERRAGMQDRLLSRLNSLLVTLY